MIGMDPLSLLLGVGIGIIACLVSGVFITAAALFRAVFNRYDSNPERAPRAMLPPATALAVRRARRLSLADITAAMHRGRR